MCVGFLKQVKKKQRMYKATNMLIYKISANPQQEEKCSYVGSVE